MDTIANARPLGAGADRDRHADEADRDSGAACCPAQNARPNPQITVPGHPSPPAPTGAPQTGPFPLIHVSDLLKQPAPLRWLVRGYLLPASLALLFGEPAAGKSLLALRWAVDLVLSGQFVVIIAGEGQFGLSRRLKAMAQHLGREDDLAKAPLVISETGASMVDRASLRAVTRAIDALKSAHGAPAVIIVDTLHRNLGPGDENSAKDMGEFVRAADRLRTRYSAAVLVVHHSGHHNKDRARGSSSLWGAVDTELRLSADDDEGKGKGERVLEVTKMKDAPTPEPAGFKLEQVTLPWLDEDGNPETSVVLVHTGAPIAPKKALEARPTKEQRLGFEALCAAVRDRSIPPPWAPRGEADPPRVVEDKDWRQAFYARHEGTQEARKKAFQRARQSLTTKQAVGVHGTYCWPTPERGPWPSLNPPKSMGEVLTDFGAALAQQTPETQNGKKVNQAERDAGQDGTFAGLVPPQEPGERDRRDNPL